MKLLVLGGTLFLGRHIVQAALDRRHDVTLFNRGHTCPTLFPDTEKLCGDRGPLLHPARVRRGASPHLGERLMGGMGRIALWGDGRHGHGDGPLGAIDPPVRAAPADAVCLTGARVRRGHRGSPARRSATSHPGGGCPADVRWGWPGLLSGTARR